MRIGVPREIKDHEFRVAITPAGVHELVKAGHEVVVEAGAGIGSSITDTELTAAGARLLSQAEQVWEQADLILKVKEPQPCEFPLMRDGQVLFTYLHLAAEPEVAAALVDRKVTGIAYETVQTSAGSLPLLYPMSEIAGSLASALGASYLLGCNGGRGVLMGGIGGVADAKVVILGAGVAGQNAARVASGMGADVTVMDVSLDKLRTLGWRWHGRVKTAVSNDWTLREELRHADLVVGSVLVPGAKAPKLVSNQLVADMKPGSVLVDIAVDQGGCFEDTRPTTHSDPTFRVHGSTFYCVTNMPGAVAHTSTWALTNATLPYVKALAELGWEEACRRDPALRLGVNSHGGAITCAPVAQALGVELAELPR